MHRDARERVVRAADRSIGLSALGYYLPKNRRSVEELALSQETTSSAEKLRRLGFEDAYLAEDEDAESMAIAAVRDLERRSGFDLERIDMILYGGGIGTSSIVDPGADYTWTRAHNPLPLFKFPGCKLQHDLGLPQVPVMGVTQLACSTFQASVRMARALLLTEPNIRHVLCVASDRFPKGCNREIVYNLMSDAACAGVVSRESERNRIVACGQITRGAYWDCERNHDQLIAGFFPLVREAIHETLRDVALTPEWIDKMIPHNVNYKSWEILARILNFPLDRMYTNNIARMGHAVASDNVINYLDAIDAGFIRPEDHVAWFVTGFGAHWNCLLLEA
jgi:3-oxoacyl-[acyl-carrier-protein] synthase-3